MNFLQMHFSISKCLKGHSGERVHESVGKQNFLRHHLRLPYLGLTCSNLGSNQYDDDDEEEEEDGV